MAMCYSKKLILVCLLLSCILHCICADDSENADIVDQSFPPAAVSIDPFADKILKMHVSLFNNPSYWFESGQWRRDDAYTWLSGGENEIVSPYQFNVIKQVHYYRYKNIHPLDPLYFMKDEATTAFLKRFCFYRFTGKTLIPAVDVYLFPLDMETNLVFSYALPTRFEKVWGHRIPRDWVSLEEHPYVQEHFPGKKFYEFDPVGIVLPDGKVFLYDWIVKQNKRKAGDILNYIPHQDDYPAPASVSGPGYSPYREAYKNFKF